MGFTTFLDKAKQISQKKTQHQQTEDNLYKPLPSGNDGATQSLDGPTRVSPYSAPTQPKPTEPIGTFPTQSDNGGVVGPTVVGTPVNANGQITPAGPPQALQSAPATRPNELRYVEGVNLPTTPMPTYAPQNFAQFMGPDMGNIDAQSLSLMQAILANPHTLNDQAIAQMKEAQKEEALLLRNQSQQGLDQAFAARGRIGSGRGDLASRALDENMMNAILSGNRGIDLQRVATNRADELAALQAGDAFSTGRLNRSVLGYNTQLGGQTAQADENYRGFQSQQQAVADAVQRALSQFAINQGVAGNAAQNYNTDVAAQFQGADLAERARQFNNTLGFNYNQLDQNSQNLLIDFFLRGGR